ncbi:MAG: hypothetical protein ABR562_06860 [Thermoplasmatota archaeon]
MPLGVSLGLALAILPALGGIIGLWVGAPIYGSVNAAGFLIPWFMVGVPLLYVALVLAIAFGQGRRRMLTGFGIGGVIGLSLFGISCFTLYRTWN